MKIANVVVGQTVKYNQGKGKGRKAEVTAVDPETGRVSLKSLGQGREFTRDAKLITAARS